MAGVQLQRLLSPGSLTSLFMVKMESFRLFFFFFFFGLLVEVHFFTGFF